MYTKREKIENSESKPAFKTITATIILFGACYQH